MPLSNLEKITQLLREDPFLVREPISQDSHVMQFEGWDSMKYLMFLVEFEKRFALALEPEKMGGLQTINDFLRLIKQ